MSGLVRDRFKGLSNHEKIKRIVAVRPATICVPPHLDVAVAAQIVEQTLAGVYLPTQFAVEFIAEMVGRAENFNHQMFSSYPECMSMVYYPPALNIFPTCLTGLAGIGKSETIKALMKVLPPPVDIVTQHGAVRMLSNWHASGVGKPSPRQLLMDFLQVGSAAQRINLSKLIVECRRRVNRDGICLLSLDETQNFNTGAGVVRAVDVLMAMITLGPPTVYATNFSLLHKLRDRNSEDQQRLLRDVRVMLPDPPGSDCWSEYVEEVVRVCSNVTKLRTKQLASELYRLTFGIKRLAVLLIKCAYLEARRRRSFEIDMEHIYCAYSSVSYATSKREVELLHRAAIEGQGILKNDLRCPFELPECYSSVVSSFAREERDNRFREEVIHASLSQNERQILAEVAHAAKVSSRPAKASRPKPVPKPSLRELKEAHYNSLESREK